MSNQRMNADATLALRAKTGCAGYADTLGLLMKRIVLLLPWFVISTSGVYAEVKDGLSPNKRYEVFAPDGRTEETGPREINQIYLVDHKTKEKKDITFYSFIPIIDVHWNDQSTYLAISYSGTKNSRGTKVYDVRNGVSRVSELNFPELKGEDWIKEWKPSKNSFVYTSIQAVKWNKENSLTLKLNTHFYPPEEFLALIKKCDFPYNESEGINNWSNIEQDGVLEIGSKNEIKIMNVRGARFEQ